MSRQLFELCGQDKSTRFSPYVWRARLSLCQKNLPFEGVPATYHEKDRIALSGCQTFPVLKDGETWVGDSWKIAEYLEKTYPKDPSLFGSKEGKAYSRFMNHFFNTQIHSKIFMLIAPDIHAILDEGDQDYFYKTRSKRINMPLEDLIPLRDKHLAALKASYAPLKLMLAEGEYFSGPTPLYPDFIAFAAFKWAAKSSPFEILEGEDVLIAWLARMEKFYGGKVSDLEANPLL